MTATVSQLFRYPVKSMAGETHTSLEFSERGAVGDRVWAVRDEVRGGIRGGKKIPSLMTLAARFAGEVEATGSSPAIITAPDGSTRDTGSEDINDWLSEKLAHPVTLWPLLPAQALEHYRRGAPDHEDFETELREMFARADDEPLPDLALFAEVVEYESPPGTYFDAFPVHLLTRQSLASMARYRSESSFHVDRFRPNVLLDAPDSDHPFPETAWVGRRIGIGELEFDIVGECPRCAMTTHGFGNLPKDPGIMRALVEANNGNIGVYARVVKAGRLHVGDRVG
ncbi:MAG: MOSC domain-containing protein [Halieaceae bacterium]|nr:MOSC domain-containing protein [Halieaceae bacterium]MCP5203887.1 MOSC domain-containing protein [Pseudomonadales bacterium]